MANGILINQTTDLTEENILTALNIDDLIQISKNSQSDNFTYQIITDNFTPSNR